MDTDEAQERWRQVLEDQVALTCAAALGEPTVATLLASGQALLNRLAFDDPAEREWELL